MEHINILNRLNKLTIKVLEEAIIPSFSSVAWGKAYITIRPMEFSGDADTIRTVYWSKPQLENISENLVGYHNARQIWKDIATLSASVELFLSYAWASNELQKTFNKDNIWAQRLREFEFQNFLDASIYTIFMIRERVGLMIFERLRHEKKFGDFYARRKKEGGKTRSESRIPAFERVKEIIIEKKDDRAKDWLDKDLSALEEILQNLDNTNVKNLKKNYRNRLTHRERHYITTNTYDIRKWRRKKGEEICEKVDISKIFGILSAPDLRTIPKEDDTYRIIDEMEYFILDSSRLPVKQKEIDAFLNKVISIWTLFYEQLLRLANLNNFSLFQAAYGEFLIKKYSSGLP